MFPTPERLSKLLSAVNNILTNQVTAQDFLHLLGLMASCLELIPNARLYMRPIQLHLLCFWKPSSMNLTVKIPVTQHLKSHLRWWSDLANILKGRSLQQSQTNITITTDASNSGYGGHVMNQFVQGTWSAVQKKLHINFLELEAVFLTLKHFLPILQGQNVLIRSDNTTVVQYINKRGHTITSLVLQDLGSVELGDSEQNSDQSSPYFRQTQCLGRSAEQEQSFTHRMDIEQISSAEAVQSVGLAIDRSVCFSRESTDSDILFLVTSSSSIGTRRAVNLVGEYVCLCISPNLSHSQSSSAYEAISVPGDPDSSTVAQETLVHRPSSTSSGLSKKLPIQSNLLHQPKSKINHPNPEVFSLTAWLLSTEISKRKAFRNKLGSYSQPLGEKGHRKITLASSRNSVAGVIQGKLIHILPL